MTTDLEMDRWRDAWSADTEPLPELKRRIRRGNRRLMWGGVAIAACLVAATAAWLLNRGDGWAGFAAGMWLSTMVAGGYALWLRRGTWEPAAETTDAYLDLIHRRAVAEARKMAFIRWCWAVLLIGYAVFALTGDRFTPLRSRVLTGLSVGGMAIIVIERRRRRAAARAADLTREARAGVETNPPHRSV